MDEEEDLLDSLLAVATEHLEEFESRQNPRESLVHTTVGSGNQPKTQTCGLKETDIFQFETNLNTPSRSCKNKLNSVIHSGDTDSSDEEGNRNYEDKKYSECGREIKRLIYTNDNEIINYSHQGNPRKRVSNWKTNPHNTNIGNHNKSSSTSHQNTIGKAEKDEHKCLDVFLDPIFCMRIINPKISSAMITEKMQGRLAVRFSDLGRQIFAGNLKEKDWVLCGVVVSKSLPKTSQKGSQYSIWTLSDLKDDIKTVALFLFSSAHSLWKTVVGTVIGVLNPSIMDRREGSKDEACLSVDTAQKVMIFGQSKDFGICKSVKKNGDKCTAIVNLSKCEFCIYHIKQEYQKCSKRSELQANFAGKGLVNLRNKVLGKNEVFYAGKSYMSVPAKKSKKLEARDSNILQNLSEINGNSNRIVKAKNVTNKKKKGMARHLDVNPAQRARDLELLKMLGGATSLENKTNFSCIRSNDVSLEDSKATALNVISKLKTKQDSSYNKITNKSRHYDLKGDLFVNVVNKDTFLGKVSENVSLHDSKRTALSVISKLKAKNANSGQSKNEITDESEPLMSLDEFEAELNCDKLNYSDDEDSAALPTVNLSLTASQKLETAVKNKFIKKSLKLETPKSSSKVLLNLNSPTGSKVSHSRQTLFNSSISKSALSPKISQSNLNVPLQSANQMCDSRGNVTQSLNFNMQNKHTNLESSLDKMTMGVPMLSGFGNGNVDLSKPISTRQVDRAKINAIKYIQRNGPIKKIDPNKVTNGTGAKKRNIATMLGFNNDLELNEENTSKKSKLQESDFISERFKKMMAMTSKHADLLEQHDNEQKEKYFNRLEVKEKMEEKMVNTHKVKCKAVKCLQCKYTSFSASDLCKSERHPLKICTKFNEIGSKLLSRGFIQLEKRHATIYKRVKSALPRRESERKVHPLAKHIDILQAVDTRISMLNMTYMRYIQNRLICFIPGKVLDETKSILDFVESNKNPPRTTHQLLQELRDLSSMAIEHFDENILPRCRELFDPLGALGSQGKLLKNLEVVAGSLTPPLKKFPGIPYKNLVSTSSKPPVGILIEQCVLSGELGRVKKVAKNHKHHIKFLTQNTQKLCIKLRKQNNKLRIQTAKLRQQERKLQEQNSKIMEQEVALSDVKKHIDEWDQKYKDLTVEWVRARDEILLNSSSGNSPPILNGNYAQNTPFKSNIKPRMAHILPKSYLGFDIERKRKSSLCAEIPLKRNRSPSAPGLSSPQKASKNVQNVRLNIPDLVHFERNDSNKESEANLLSTVENNAVTISKERHALLTTFFDNLRRGNKGQKRKIAEDIDLK